MVDSTAAGFAQGYDRPVARELFAGICVSDYAAARRAEGNAIGFGGVPA